MNINYDSKADSDFRDIYVSFIKASNDFADTLGLEEESLNNTEDKLIEQYENVYWNGEAYKDAILEKAPEIFLDRDYVKNFQTIILKHLLITEAQAAFFVIENNSSQELVNANKELRQKYFLKMLYLYPEQYLFYKYREKALNNLHLVGLIIFQDGIYFNLNTHLV